MDASEHDAIKYDHKKRSKPNLKILGGDTFSLELGKNPAP